MHIKKAQEQVQQNLTAAKALSKQQKYEQAILLLKKTMKTLEEEEEWEGFMEVVCQLSSIYVEADEYTPAIEIIEHTLKIHQEKCPHLIAWKVKLYTNLAKALSSFDIEQAIYYNENALVLLEKIGQKNTPQFFTILSNLASIQLWHSPIKGIEYSKRALELGQKIFKEKADIHCEILYRNIAIGYKDIGDMDTALIYYQKRLNLLRTSSLYGENHKRTLDAYFTLGVFWTENQNYSEGLRYLEIVLKKFKEKYEKSNFRIGLIYMNIAYNYYLQSEPLTALKYSQLTFKVFVLGYQENNFYALPSLDQCFLVDSMVFFTFLKERALMLLNYFHVLKKKQSLNAIKAIEASLATCQFAIDYVQELWKGFKTDGAKFNFAGKTPSLYELSIKITLYLSNYLEDPVILERAFTFLELAKATILRISMQENEAKLRAEIDSNLLKQEKKFKERIEIYLQKIQKEETKGKGKNEKALKEWKQKHLNAFQSHQKIIERFEKDYPEYYQMKYNFQTVSVTDLQADLNENTAIVSYFAGHESSYAFVVTTEDYEVIELDLPTHLDQQIQAYLNAIHAHDYATFNELSHQLYYHLIRPIDYLIFDPFEEEAKDLVIIPTASLHYLPFETLIRTKSQKSNVNFQQLDYLIRHCQIQYHYSATLFHQRMQSAKAKRKIDLLPSPSSNISNTSNAIDFVGFAPVYNSGKKATQAALRELAADYSQWATRSEAIRNGQLVPLPFSEQEVQNIQNLFTEKGLEGKSLLYEAASKTQFKSLASNAKYLHIAAHGLTNDQYPKLSGIVFHPSEKSIDIQDSVLSMGEMYQLQLQADLVVLSSCESGIGTLARGEGMIAMNRSFLYAGAKNVVFTLFKVLDKPSSDLCNALFEAILEGKSYSEALREAKLKLIEQEGVDPKSWCGFVLLGA